MKWLVTAVIKCTFKISSWIPVQLMCFYLKHVRVVVMTVLHNHRVVSGQSVWDAVLTFTVHRLKDNRQTITKEIKYLVLQNTRSQTTTNASSKYKKCDCLLFFSSLPGESYRAMCQRITRLQQPTSSFSLYRKVIKTKLLCSNCFRCYICFTQNISCIIPQKEKKNCARNFQQRNTKSQREKSHSRDSDHKLAWVNTSSAPSWSLSVSAVSQGALKPLRQGSRPH